MEEFLSNLNDDITKLDISNKGLKILPDLSRFTNLKILNCHNNNIKTLNNLPQYLEELNCYDNLIVRLDNLPMNLKKLNCKNNKIKNLDNLPITLNKLECLNNSLSKINYLPNYLEKLNCANNNIKKIYFLPINLKKFDFTKNTGIEKTLTKKSEKLFEIMIPSIEIYSNGINTNIKKPLILPPVNNININHIMTEQNYNTIHVVIPQKKNIFYKCVSWLFSQFAIFINRI